MRATTLISGLVGWQLEVSIGIRNCSNIDSVFGRTIANFIGQFRTSTVTSPKKLVNLMFSFEKELLSCQDSIYEAPKNIKCHVLDMNPLLMFDMNPLLMFGLFSDTPLPPTIFGQRSA